MAARRAAPWFNFAPTVYYSEGGSPVPQLWPDLVLVMDACPGGDLSVFALTDERLSPEQVRFVGMAVAAVLAFLHSRFVREFP